MRNLTLALLATLAACTGEIAGTQPNEVVDLVTNVNSVGNDPTTGLPDCGCGAILEMCPGFDQPCDGTTGQCASACDSTNSVCLRCDSTGVCDICNGALCVEVTCQDWYVACEQRCLANNPPTPPPCASGTANCEPPPPACDPANTSTGVACPPPPCDSTTGLCAPDVCPSGASCPPADCNDPAGTACPMPPAPCSSTDPTGANCPVPPPAPCSSTDPTGANCPPPPPPNLPPPCSPGSTGCTWGTPP